MKCENEVAIYRLINGIAHFSLGRFFPMRNEGCLRAAEVDSAAAPLPTNASPFVTHEKVRAYQVSGGTASS